MRGEISLLLTIIILSGQALAFEFCDEGTVGENDIRLISVNDMLKENQKEWIWEPSQKIEIESRVENKGDKEETFILEAIFKDKDETIKIAKDSDDLKKEFSLSAGERKSVSLLFQTNEDIEIGNYDVYIKFYKKNNEDEQCVENNEEEVKIQIIELCENGKVDEDNLEIEKINDEKEDNEKEWQWAPGNEIRISLELSNKDYSSKNFIVELVFLDENKEEVFLADNTKDTQKEKTLDEGESDELSFNFNLRPDIEEAKYTLYAKAYDEDNEDICTSLKAESKSDPIYIEIEKEERKVIVTNIEGPKEAKTSSSIEYTVELTNLGSEDEESVLAVIYNYQLGITEKREIKNLESGETKSTTFQIQIPNNASISKYAILFSTEYEYNERQDYYKSSSDEKDDIKKFLTITQEEIQKNETVKEINETITKNNQTKNESLEISIKNETKPIQTTITGNVVGTPNKSPNPLILLTLLILAIIGIILFFKKPKRKAEAEIKPPKVIRKYTAKLN